MYSDKVDTDYFNLSVDGYDIIAEDINPNESYNRRETVRKNIIGGTQQVIRGGYIHRDWTITTHFLIDPLFPDVYDDIIREWQSKPVEVISKELGGKFNAEIIIKKHHESPNYLKIEMQIIEIPTNETLIPNDSMKIPTDELVTVSSSKDTNNNKKTTKTTKTSNKTNTKKNKGSNVTKTKKNK